MVLKKMEYWVCYAQVFSCTPVIEDPAWDPPAKTTLPDNELSYFEPVL